MKNNQFKYDVAISFANEDLNIALCIYLALKLKRKKGKIFYYTETFDNVGKSLNHELPKIYGTDAQFIVVLVSKNYLNEEKVYAALESKVIIDRWKSDPEKSFFIPLLIDDTLVSDIDPVLPNDIAYVQWNANPEKIAKKIWSMIEVTKNKRESTHFVRNNGIDNSNATIKGEKIIQIGHSRGDIKINE